MKTTIDKTWKTRAGLDAIISLHEIELPEPRQDKWRCGYVEIPEGHPLHGEDYSDHYDKNVHCHGGVTFSGPHGAGGGGWYWGFDCHHYQDTLVDWPVSRVEAECETLAEQIMAIADTNKARGETKKEIRHE